MAQQTLLVNAQSVSKTWYCIIHNSPHLLRALFFEPLPGAPLQWFGRGRDSARYVARGGWKRNRSDPCYVLVLANPWLRKILNYKTANPYRPEFDHPDASWRYMLATQPPLDRFEIMRYGVPGNLRTIDLVANHIGLYCGIYIRTRNMVPSLTANYAYDVRERASDWVLHSDGRCERVTVDEVFEQSTEGRSLPMDLVPGDLHPEMSM